LKALIVVDLQNDFMPGGSLAVRDGNQVVPLANALMSRFDLVVATLDWHPANHGSFASQHEGKMPGELMKLKGLDQVLWPDHCVQNTKGSELVVELNQKAIHHRFYKGTDPNIDSYSAFFDNAHLKSTGLGDFLKEKGVEQLYVLGLATDYCVKYSVLDAIHLGFKTSVFIDACRGVELSPGDVDRAVADMHRAGANIVSSQAQAHKPPVSLHG
jgi:nicotinamidase/pyrazinamidase